MYGLKQEAIISYNKLIPRMEPHGYYPFPFTTGLWAHQTRIVFGLCVNDFGVKYFSKYDADHFLDSLKNCYEISTDWEGHNYLGLKIYLNYNK